MACKQQGGGEAPNSTVLTAIQLDVSLVGPEADAVNSVEHLRSEVLLSNPQADFGREEREERAGSVGTEYNAFSLDD